MTEVQKARRSAGLWIAFLFGAVPAMYYFLGFTFFTGFMTMAALIALAVNVLILETAA